MKRKDGSFIAGMKDSLGNAEVKAPEGLFEDIEAQMAARGLAAGRPAPKKPVWHLVWIPAAVAAALITAVVLFPGTPSVSEPMMEPLAAVEKPAAVAEEPNAAAVPDLVAEVQIGVLPAAPEDSRLATSELPATAGIKEQEKDISEVMVGVTDNTVPVEPEAVTVVPVDETEAEMEWDEYLETGGPEEKKKVRISASLALNGVTSSESNDVTLMSVPVKRPAMSHSEHLESAEVYNVDNFKADTGERHYQPVKVGALVGFRITDWMKVSTGLNYTYLHSEFDFNNNTTSMATRQDLHFIGIPLNLQFRLFEVRFFSAYVGVGTEADFLASGRHVTANDFVGRSSSSQRLKLHDNHAFISLNAGLGLNFRIWGPVNIYVEPGVTYNFRNGSPLKTVWSDKPLNFGLNLGFRFDL